MSKRKRDTYRRQQVNKFFDKLKVNKSKKKKSPHNITLKDAPFKIAIVIDGEVQDIIHCNERLFYLLTSQPQILDISNESVEVGDIYDYNDNRFIKDES